MGIRARWQSGRPEFVVLAGSALGVLGNVAWIPWAMAYEGGAQWPTSVGLAVAGIALSALAPLPLRSPPPHTGLRFGLAGLAASVVALLTPPGIVGGGVALAGAVWGIIAESPGR